MNGLAIVGLFCAGLFFLIGAAFPDASKRVRTIFIVLAIVHTLPGFVALWIAAIFGG